MIVPKSSLLQRRFALVDSSQTEKFPYFCEVCGVRLIVRKGVFSPKYFESTKIFAEIFPYRKSDVILDVGCGTGIIMVRALMQGADFSAGVDISSSAVRNSRENLKLHGLCNRAVVNLGNLYNTFQKKQFQTIFWNAPWVFAPASARIRRKPYLAICDPGYKSIGMFFRNSWDYLKPKGRLLIGLGDFLNQNEMTRVARESQVHLKALVSKRGVDANYTIFEVLLDRK